ncbi:sulfonate transport system permease protein [Arthrobacter globiformis]|uniref:ABC transporter permease n=1 Tax=Arthrobacter globiformis TaxID=1665 RepID=UPI002782DD1D|nr:ABC transporter permease [Arthrobacter globiformis]MDQ1060829.1 sulfonate transport system permease protein [Arthrobacter globiformis]
MRAVLGKTTNLVTEVWLPVAGFLAWWILSSTSTSLYFPPLSRITTEIGTVMTARFETDILPSLQNLGAGLAVSVILGIAIGLLLGLVPALYTALQPLLEFMRAIPGVALLPIALFMFGIGAEMKVAIIVFGAFWPVLMNTIDGIRGIDVLVKDVARSYTIRRRDYLWRIILPAASPQIIAGIRISVSLGVILIVASEYVASTEGIGYIELQSARQYDMDVMWAALLILGILGYLSNVLFRIIEHRLLRWHRGLRGTDQGGPQ